MGENTTSGTTLRMIKDSLVADRFSKIIFMNENVGFLSQFSKHAINNTLALIEKASRQGILTFTGPATAFNNQHMPGSNYHCISGIKGRRKWTISPLILIICKIFKFFLNI